MKRLLLLILIALVFSPAAFAQGGARPKPQGGVLRVPGFKGNGVARVPGSRPSQAPNPLNQLAMKEIYKQLGKVEPGSLYVKLTASQPSISHKGVLVFVKADIVESGQNYAQWRPDYKLPPGKGGSLNLWLRSNANRRYLIDCTVEEDAPLAQARAWSVVGPDNTTQTWSASATHLVFTLDAATSGWYGFSIFGVNRWWFFHSCEVTNL